MKHYFLTALLLLSAIYVTAQSGSISGTIRDKEMNNEPLPFANAFIKGTTKGTTTDMEGNFVIENLSPGTYTLVFSFVGYETLEKNNVVVEAGKETKVEAVLGTGSVSLEEVVVQVELNRQKESVLLAAQKNAVEMSENIGVAQLSKQGVSDAATAVTKATGTQKQESTGEIFVRGLGDRFNTTTMNRLPISSDNPENKNISLDLFGTGIIEYINIEKAFSSRLSGDFGGANININSKEHRGDSYMKVGVSSGVNMTAMKVKDNFKLQDGPNFLGYSNVSIPQTPLNQYNYSTSWDFNNQKTPVNSEIDIEGGKKIIFENSNSLSVFAYAGFSNNYSYSEGVTGDFDSAGNQTKNFERKTYTYETNITALANLFYRTPNAKYRFSSNYVHSSSQEARNLTGYTYDFKNLLVKRGTFRETSLLVNQLGADYKLSETSDLEWSLGYNRVVSAIPDRIQSYLQKEATGGYTVLKEAALNNRYYDKLTDNDFNGLLTYSKEFGDVKLTLGYQGRYFKKDFTNTQIGFRVSGTQNTAAIPNADSIDHFFNQENLTKNLFQISTTRGGLNPMNPFGYEGSQMLNGVYADMSYDINEKLILQGGVRYDKINQAVSWDINVTPATGNRNKDYNKFLPSLNLKYALNDKQNLRFAVSRTYTLPQLKEISPYIYYDVTEAYFGNPDLYPSDNNNLDIKWEYFMKSDELISLTGFGKYIQNPIARANLASAGTELTYYNVGDYASIIGLEAEFRKNLWKVDKNKLYTFITATYMNSRLQLNKEKIQRETANGTAPSLDYNKIQRLPGASDVLANVNLGWHQNMGERELDLVVSYSYVGDNVFSLGANNLGNIVENARNFLDMNLNFKVNESLSLSAGAKNILNTRFNQIQQNATNSLKDSYEKGTRIKFGVSYKF